MVISADTSAPFLDVTVQPLYGQFRAIIRWQARPDLQAAVFEVAKSHDGVNDWKVIGTVVADDHFVDTNLLNQGKLQEHYYQVTALLNGQRFVSPRIGTFGKVSRDEFGAARRIMEIEYEALRMFTRVHLRKLRVFAPPCPVCVDPDTDQAIGVSRCLNCFGTHKDKGYADPVVTFMRIMTISPTAQHDSTTGTGATDPSQQTARMPAFPLLRKNDLLEHREADRRYLVNEVDYARLGGKIPVVATVSLMLLPSTDIRYQLPAVL